jgi:hypothetical protein
VFLKLSTVADHFTGGRRTCRPLAVSEEKTQQKLCQTLKEGKNTPLDVCAKTAFVGHPSTESRRINSFHKFLSFNHCFRKYFKLV